MGAIAKTVCTTALFLGLCAVALAVPLAPQGRPTEEREEMDMPPAPRPVVTLPPRMPWPPGVPVSHQVNVNASGQNIPGDAANEPSLAVDPTNPNHIVAGWRQFDSVSSNFRQAGHAYSTDGGNSWTFPGVFTPGTFRSDPVLESSAGGTVYYDSLEGTFQCDVFPSTDGGATWGAFAPAFGGDKQWLAVDRTNGTGRNFLYEAWSSQASTTNGVFTRSTNGGLSWMTPITLPQDAIFGTLDVAGNGDVYVIGNDVNNASVFWIARSSNAQNGGVTPTWDLSKSLSLGGDQTGGGLNPAGLLGQAWIDFDRSSGPFAGYVYALCSVDPPGADPVDVMIARSTDGGVSWGAPVRVNDDASTSNWQWFGTLGVAPGGRVDVIWNDTRNDNTAQFSELYYASSTDGGATFSPNVAVGAPFDPTIGWPQQNKIGDYSDIVSDDNGADVIYAATYNGEEDVYFVRLGASCPSITLSPAALPGGAVGQSYAQTITASGGAAPYTFALGGGALPPGLSLSSGGVLSGTPSVAGTYGFTITATDADGCVGGHAYSIAVNGSGCGTIVLAPATLPGAIVGAPYSRTITASGGTAPYAFTVTAGTLPTGLALATSGVLAGTPTAPGSFTFTVTATDAAACTGSRAYVVTATETVDFIVGQGFGPANPNEVKVRAGSGAATSVDFMAYAAGAWGANVAGADVNGGAYDEILTGPGPGTMFGPQVRGFDRAGGALAVNFYAYGTLRYGVNVAGGRLDADGYDEIATGPGPGVVFGPHVRGFNVDAGPVAAMAKVSFYAYSTLRYGVNVTSGAVDADIYDEIVTAPGPGAVFGPVVRGFNYDGTAVTSIGKINFSAFAVAQYGANVAAGDVDADGYAEIVATPGPGSGTGFPSRFLGFNYDGAAIAALPGFDVTPYATTYGGRVGTGDVSGDGRVDLLCGAGRDPAASSLVMPYTYNGSALQLLGSSFTPFPSSAYGVNVASGGLGY